MWKCYALFSAFFAALTAIFAKVGVRDINSDLATAIRTTVVLFIAWGVVLFGSHVGEIRDLTTELGHYLADLIFKEKGVRSFSRDGAFDRWGNPSFVSLYVGMNVPLSGYDLDEEHELSTSSGSTAGVEGRGSRTPTWVWAGALPLRTPLSS